MISAAGRVGWEEARRVTTNDAPLSDKDFRAKQEERFAKLGLRKQREGRSMQLPVPCCHVEKWQH